MNLSGDMSNGSEGISDIGLYNTRGLRYRDDVVHSIEESCAQVHLKVGHKIS